VIYLAMAPKSNAGYNAYNAARAFVKQDKSREVPVHLRNAPTGLMKELGYGTATAMRTTSRTPMQPARPTCPTACNLRLVPAGSAGAGDQDRREDGVSAPAG
jgi:hypothetical protein